MCFTSWRCRVVLLVGGDDALEPDVFKGVQEYITINNVDVNEAVGIFCDYSSVNPMGEVYASNKKS